MAKVTNRKKKVTTVEKGRIYIQSTFNNTIITLTDGQGNALEWETAGHAGFKGTRKSTPYAAQSAMKNVVEKAHGYKIQEVSIFIKGVGSGRDAAVRALQGTGIMITHIEDRTPIAHNGVRAKKARRV